MDGSEILSGMPVRLDKKTENHLKYIFLHHKLLNIRWTQYPILINYLNKSISDSHGLHLILTNNTYADNQSINIYLNNSNIVVFIF